MTCFVVVPILVPIYLKSSFFFLRLFSISKMYWTGCARKCMMEYSLYLSHRQRNSFRCIFSSFRLSVSVSTALTISNQIKKGSFKWLFFNKISILLLLFALFSVGVRLKVLFIETCHRFFFSSTFPIFPSDTCMCTMWIECSSTRWMSFSEWCS